MVLDYSIKSNDVYYEGCLPIGSIFHDYRDETFIKRKDMSLVNVKFDASKKLSVIEELLYVGNTTPQSNVKVAVWLEEFSRSTFKPYNEIKPDLIEVQLPDGFEVGSMIVGGVYGVYIHTNSIIEIITSSTLYMKLNTVGDIVAVITNINKVDNNLYSCKYKPTTNDGLITSSVRSDLKMIYGEPYETALLRFKDTTYGKERFIGYYPVVNFRDLLDIDDNLKLVEYNYQHLYSYIIFESRNSIRDINTLKGRMQNYIDRAIQQIATYPSLTPPPVIIEYPYETNVFGENYRIVLSMGDLGYGYIIKYTLDGSTPNETSLVYTGEILCDESVQLRARSYYPDKNILGDISSMDINFTYDVVDPPPLPDDDYIEYVENNSLYIFINHKFSHDMPENFYEMYTIDTNTQTLLSRVSQTSIPSKDYDTKDTVIGTKTKIVENKYSNSVVVGFQMFNIWTINGTNQALSYHVRIPITTYRDDVSEPWAPNYKSTHFTFDDIVYKTSGIKSITWNSSIGMVVYTYSKDIDVLNTIDDTYTAHSSSLTTESQNGYGVTVKDGNKCNIIHYNYADLFMETFSKDTLTIVNSKAILTDYIDVGLKHSGCNSKTNAYIYADNVIVKIDMVTNTDHMISNTLPQTSTTLMSKNTGYNPSKAGKGYAVESDDRYYRIFHSATETFSPQMQVYTGLYMSPDNKPVGANFKSGATYDEL